MLDVPSYLLGKQSSGGGGLNWSAIGYSEEPESIEEDYNYSKNIYDNWDTTRTSYGNLYYNNSNLVFFPLVDTSAGTNFQTMFSGCVSLQTMPLINTSNGTVFSSMFQNCRRLTEIPQLDISNGANLNLMFSGCTKLKKVPVLNLSKATNINGMFSSCISLTDESLDNILQSCININPNYLNTKAFAVMGFISTYYPASRIQALPHYQDFIDAGWTIGY